MLKRENRLKKNKHFNYIYKHGKSVGSKELTLVYVKAKVKPFKVGFSVSNKVGKAVVRNKIKRRMREAFASFIPLVDRRFNYIFVAKPAVANLNYADIKTAMLSLIKKAGLVNEDNQNNS